MGLKLTNEAPVGIKAGLPVGHPGRILNFKT